MARSAARQVLPRPGERWRYKQNRGSGTFTVVGVSRDRVTMSGNLGGTKNISLRTLRGDYERAD
jgi:hypothetical protein